jgi:hypothetical protein
MPSTGAELTADQVLAFLDERDNEQRREAVPAEHLRACREAAAVLASIENPDALQAVGANVSPGDITRILGAELIPVTGRKFQGRVMLAPDVRVATLRDLAQSNRVSEALAANPDERTGRLQEQLERYLSGTAPALEEQTLAELDETHQVILWLGDAIEGLPSEEEVSDRSAYLRLLAPFEAIAGDHVFRGRRRELDQLRSYIGVLSPESFLRRLRSIAVEWTRPERRRALSISGPGGVGKSALVARFMLEHTRLPEEARVPFAYLDFDRADLDVGDPLGLCFEMIDQLDTQFPSGGRFENLQAFADHHRDDFRAEDQMGPAQSLLADLLGVMNNVLGPRPYVVVLDTFESVQYRGEARAFPLWLLLNELQEHAPFLRVVVAGRAPVESLRLAGSSPFQLEVGDLDDDAAVAFLQSEGVRDKRLAEQLVGKYGGVPLSLKLAASLAAKSPDLLRGGRLAALASEVIQGQLYERILDHVGNEQVRRLAHPGLVLRRIDPTIILEVLNKPCELRLTGIGEAEHLFEELQRETSLVAVDDDDGSLVHRADLRRVMLKLLVESEPHRVEQIHDSAVSWYSSQTGRRAQAEEMYHRLQLGQWVDEKGLSDAEVRGSIQSAMVEFPVEVQLRLATLGFQVPEEIRRQGTQEQDDASTAALVEEYLSYGESSQAEAARILRDATKGLDRPSPLFRAAARLAAQQSDPAAARDWIERGLEQSVAGGNTRLTLELLQEKAWLLRGASTTERDATMRQLADAATRHHHREAALQHRLQALDLRDESKERSLSVLEELLEHTEPEDVWGLTPAFQPAIVLAVKGKRWTLVDALRRLILAEQSPFRYAGFPDRRAQRTLETLLREAAGSEVKRFGKAYLELCKAWPYRVLFVRPPFGRSGEVLTESAVA